MVVSDHAHALQLSERLHVKNRRKTFACVLDLHSADGMRYVCMCVCICICECIYVLTYIVIPHVYIYARQTQMTGVCLRP